MVDLDKIKQLYKFSKHLSLSDASDLMKAAKSRTFEKKEVILNEGSNRNEILYVRHGLIRKYSINRKGEEITFDLIPEHYVMANVDVILFDQPSRFYYEAFEKTKTFYIDYSMLQEIIVNNSTLQTNRIKFAHLQMKDMHRRIEMFVLHTPEERYLKFIEEYPDLSNRVPDKYLASVLGITSVSLSRIRARITNH